MSPLAIARNVDRVKRLRTLALDAQYAKTPDARTLQADAERLARQTAAAVRQSASLAENVKESLLHTLEPR
jgi:hypothetical protein